jgi:pyridoxamine 5'-phosphate oxidase
MNSMEWRDEALDWDALPEQPMDLFAQWHKLAAMVEPWGAGAMLLSTANKQAQPSSRIVLMRGFGAFGFRFFTNYESRKGKELSENPVASAVFWWPTQVRQIRIEGVVEKLSRQDSEAYFAGRPRGSQIGAWCSEQSQQIDSLDAFQLRYDALEQKYDGADVPCPPNWGGYVLKPNQVEFWQGGRDRLHDRALYTNDINGKNDGWKLARLSP